MLVYSCCIVYASMILTLIRGLIMSVCEKIKQNSMKKESHYYQKGKHYNPVTLTLRCSVEQM